MTIFHIAAAVCVVLTIGFLYAGARQTDSPRYVRFSKTHVGAIKDQLILGRTRMTPEEADHLLTPD